MPDAILQVNNLVTSFGLDRGRFNAVDGISFDMNKGETLGVVGESGCGKSMTALSIMRLVPKPGLISEGDVLLNGTNLLKKGRTEMRRIRGNQISMIFQEPMTSLNPLFTVGNQIVEVYNVHRKLSKAAARDKAIDSLKLVGIPEPKKRFSEYPHQLSGGMRQRVMIAMALACEPQVLLADEPTTALDVTIQAQILDLLYGLKEKVNTSIMMITHDLGVVAEVADRVIVMYAGKIVEQAAIKELFRNPLHPYTQGLLGSVPRIDRTREALHEIKGTVPSLDDMPKGCRFAPRCSQRRPECQEHDPDVVEKTDGHLVKCLLYY